MNEVIEVLRELLECHDEDIGMDDYEDSESVGTEEINGKRVDMKLTFGVLRRARKLLIKLESVNAAN